MKAINKFKQVPNLPEIVDLFLTEGSKSIESGDYSNIDFLYEKVAQTINEEIPLIEEGKSDKTLEQLSTVHDLLVTSYVLLEDLASDNKIQIQAVDMVSKELKKSSHDVMMDLFTHPDKPLKKAREVLTTNKGDMQKLNDLIHIFLNTLKDK